ncbi:MAG: His/Gly/Thr/Pro-type tRNA ligase C-terminal domain-containing protein [Hyphomonadaceae bacterium]
MSNSCAGHRVEPAHRLRPALRAFVDEKDARPADKRWDWVRRGAPITCEIGPRDAGNGQVSFIKRDALREGEKIKTHTLPRADFVGEAPAMLEAVQKAMFAEAKTRPDPNVRSGVKSFEEVVDYYGTEEGSREFKGWLRVSWSRPTGAALEEVGDRLKALKLTIRQRAAGSSAQRQVSSPARTPLKKS